MEQPSKNTLIRYFRGECMPQEVELVELYLAMDLEQEFVAACMKAAWLDEENYSHLEISSVDLADFKRRFYIRKSTVEPNPVLAQPHSTPRSLAQFSAWIKVAAALLILMGIAFFSYNNIQHTLKTELVKLDTEVLPGSDKAVLTLANGSRLSLSHLATGKLAMQAGLRVEKTAEGEVVYSSKADASATTDAINTIATPRGGKYRVTLPDGTKAWLNAASSLSYPLRFKKEERRVKMTGEVYFEVAKSTSPRGGKRIPFFVETHKQVVQVLGTHFNVSAYADEQAIKTTLLEGSVKIISHKGDMVFLKPGQMSLLAGDFRVKEADTDQELAWKNGDFIFKGETLDHALRQVARWYDIEVECPPHLGKLRFNGMISRSQPLSMIVDMIQLTNLAKVTVKERRLIVTD